MTTRVSVLVPTYNRPMFLAETLQSLDRQTFADFEVLVLNDGGIYEGIHCLKGLNRLKHFRAFDLPHRGQSSALNYGLRCAIGEYVTVLHDDDTYLLGGLDLLVRMLDASPEAVAVYSLPRYVDECGIPMDRPPRLQEYLNEHAKVAWTDVLCDGLFIHGGGILYRREDLQAVGGWEPTLSTAEEFDLHLRLLKHRGPFYALDAETVTYRRHSGGKSQDRFRRRQMRRGVMRQIYARLGLSESNADAIVGQSP